MQVRREIFSPYFFKLIFFMKRKSIDNKILVANMALALFSFYFFDVHSFKYIVFNILAGVFFGMLFLDELFKLKNNLYLLIHIISYGFFYSLLLFMEDFYGILNEFSIVFPYDLLRLLAIFLLYIISLSFYYVSGVVFVYLFKK